MKGFMKVCGIIVAIALAVGVVFLAKAILNVVYPYSKMTLYVFLLALLVCVYFISKIDNRYKK